MNSTISFSSRSTVELFTKCDKLYSLYIECNELVNLRLPTFENINLSPPHWLVDDNSITFLTPSESNLNEIKYAFFENLVRSAYTLILSDFTSRLNSNYLSFNQFYLNQPREKILDLLELEYSKFSHKVKSLFNILSDYSKERHEGSFNWVGNGRVILFSDDSLFSVVHLLNFLKSGRSIIYYGSDIYETLCEEATGIVSFYLNFGSIFEAVTDATEENTECVNYRCSLYSNEYYYGEEVSKENFILDARIPRCKEEIENFERSLVVLEYLSKISSLDLSDINNSKSYIMDKITLLRMIKEYNYDNFK